MKIIDKKAFMSVVLDLKNKTFIIYVAFVIKLI